MPADLTDTGPFTQSPGASRRPGRALLRPGDVLAADGVSLRVPLPVDLAFVRALWADAETMRAVGGPVTLTGADAEHWYARMVDPGRGTDCYCLIHLPGGEAVGEISFHRLDAATMTADLNVKVLARLRGRGIARAALECFLAYFFDALGGQLLIDDVAPANAAGQALLIGQGFRRVGVSDEAVRYALTRGEYRASLTAR